MRLIGGREIRQHFQAFRHGLVPGGIGGSLAVAEKD
jgi:hypothetical protein